MLGNKLLTNLNLYNLFLGLIGDLGFEMWPYPPELILKAHLNGLYKPVQLIISI